MAATRPFPAPQSLPSLVGRPAGLTRRLRRGVRRALRAAVAVLAEHERLARERRRLAELDDRQLRDIGLTRHEAAREARRHFWD